MPAEFMYPAVRTSHPSWSRLEFGPRRAAPGAPSRKPAEEMGQPQDGAMRIDVSLDVAMTSAARTQAASSDARDLREPEDARLTGGTRSLMRRVLGLNVTQPAVNALRALPAWVRKPALQ